MNTLDRVKLLMDYDSSQTLNENIKGLLLEANILSRLSSLIDSNLENQIKKLTGIFTKDGIEIGGDEIMTALRSGTLKAESASVIRKLILNNPKSSSRLVSNLIDDLTSNPSALKKWGNASEEDILNRYRTLGFSEDASQKIAKSYKSKAVQKIVPEPNAATAGEATNVGNVVNTAVADAGLVASTVTFKEIDQQFRRFASQYPELYKRSFPYIKNYNATIAGIKNQVTKNLEGKTLDEVVEDISAKLQSTYNELDRAGVSSLERQKLKTEVEKGVLELKTAVKTNRSIKNGNRLRTAWNVTKWTSITIGAAGLIYGVFGILDYLTSLASTAKETSTAIKGATDMFNGVFPTAETPEQPIQQTQPTQQTQQSKSNTGTSLINRMGLK